MPLVILKSPPVDYAQNAALHERLQVEKAAYAKWVFMAGSLKVLTCPEIYKNDEHPLPILRKNFLIWFAALIKESQEDGEHKQDAIAALKNLLNLQWPNYQHEANTTTVQLNLPFLAGLLCANPEFFNEIIKIIPKETLKAQLIQYPKSWAWAAIILDDGIQRYHPLLKEFVGEREANKALQPQKNETPLLQLALQARDGVDQPITKETIIFLHNTLGDTDFLNLINATDASNAESTLFCAVLHKHTDAVIQIGLLLGKERFVAALQTRHLYKWNNGSYSQQSTRSLFRCMFDKELPMAWLVAEELSFNIFVSLAQHIAVSPYLSIYHLARALEYNTQNAINAKSFYTDPLNYMATSVIQDYVKLFFDPSKEIKRGHKHCLYLLFQLSNFCVKPSPTAYNYIWGRPFISGQLKEFLPEKSAEKTPEATFTNLKRSIAEIVLDAYKQTDSKNIRAQKSKGMLALLDFMLFYFDAKFEKKDEYLNQLAALLQQRELEHKDSSESYCQNPDKPVNQYYEAVILVASQTADTLTCKSFSQYCADHKAQKEAEQVPKSLLSSFSFKFLTGSSSASAAFAGTELQSAGSTSTERFVSILTIQPMLEDHSRPTAKKMMQFASAS